MSFPNTCSQLRLLKVAFNAAGTQGRIMMFNPASVELKKALPSSHPELLARFLKESSVSKQQLYPDLDHIDLQVRQENLQVRGDPVMLQLSVTPCYALTIHKTQALSIKRAFVNMRIVPAHQCHCASTRRQGTRSAGAWKGSSPSDRCTS